MKRWAKPRWLTNIHKKEFSTNHIATVCLYCTSIKYATKCDGNEIPVKIWDTAGQERFITITYSFYKKADGIIISFDITDERSFKNISNWIESIKQYADPNIPKVLVGNKIDIQER